jgi:diguanylate cyclase (GGDEF)-like protein
MSVMAKTDGLTQLFNRSEIERLIRSAVDDYRQSIVSGEKVLAPSLIMTDIDNFKKVNDRYGHKAGDAVLKALGALFRGLVEESGIEASAGRWGGEEFLLIFQGKNGDEVYSILNLFLVRLRKHDFVYKDNVINVSMTFGIAEYDSNPGIEGAIQEADEKLYFGKQRGRNCVIF